jgi:transposase
MTTSPRSWRPGCGCRPSGSGCDEHGLAVSPASFRRYVAANVPEETRRAQVRVWNPRPAEAGEQAQIDYGQLGRWLDPVTGRLRTVWAFVMVLCCSRHMFVRPVVKMDQRAWTECHVAAFEFFGGVPARLVPDNLKTGVDKPDLYDPKINRSYAELAAHYGCLIDPARAIKPRDKALSSHCIFYGLSGRVSTGCCVLGGRPVGLNGAMGGRR